MWAFVWFAVFATAYVFSVASDAPIELLYAWLFGACATAIVMRLHDADGRTFSPSLRTLRTIAVRAASGALSESWLLLGPRLIEQLSGRAPSGRFIRIAIDRGSGSAADAGRIACVLWASSFTPNAIPLFLDRGALVLHQLVRRREPNADDPDLPV